MNVDWMVYQRKIRKYEPTFDAMIEDFLDCVFGEYANRGSYEEICNSLAKNGWKYFQLDNLNEFFAITLERCGTVEVPDVQLPAMEYEASEPIELSLLQQKMSELDAKKRQEYQTPSLVRDDDDEDGVGLQVRMSTHSDKIFQVRKATESSEV